MPVRASGVFFCFYKKNPSAFGGGIVWLANADAMVWRLQRREMILVFSF